jgi:hypothetical protein
MNRITRNLTILYRSERLIAKRQLAVLRRQTGLMAAAGLVAGLGIIMLNLSAYLALAQSYSQPTAALMVALANLVFAGLLIVYAQNQSAEREIEPVTEVRDMALEDLESEAQAVADEARAVVDEVRSIARDPLGAVMPGIMGTAAKAAMKSMKSKS